MIQRRVDEVMTRDLVAVPPTAGYKEIAELLHRQRISAVPVIDEEGRPVGVISEGDLLPKEAEFAALHRGAWVDARHPVRDLRRVEAVGAADLMSSPVVTITPDASVALAARRMRDARVKRLIVVGPDGRAMGLISRADIIAVFCCSDEELRRRVLDALQVRSLWTDVSTLDIAVRDGVVTISGDVERHSDANAVIGLASLVDGVVDVRETLRFRIDDLHGSEVR